VCMQLRNHTIVRLMDLKGSDRRDRRATELILRRLPRGTEENHEKPVRISSVLGEIRIWHLLNTIKSSGRVQLKCDGTR
jgi:hypothetical protein